MSKQEFRDELNFPKVLFFHMNRILMSTSQPHLFIFNIEAFEDVMYPYEDDEYDEDIIDADDKFKAASVIDPMYRGKDAMIDSARLELARKKFRALMKLAERKNLLLTRVNRDQVWELEEEDEDEL